MPGTGHIATVNLPQHMMITNRYVMLEDLSQNLLQRGTRTGRLSDRADFATLLDDMPASGNLFVWLNPRSGSGVLQRQAEAAARQRLESSIDLVQVRRQFEPEARRDVVSGKPRNQLTADEVARLDQELDTRVAAHRDKVLREQLPAALEDARRQVTYLRAMSSCMVWLDLEEKWFRLAARAIVPAEGPREAAAE